MASEAATADIPTRLLKKHKTVIDLAAALQLTRYQTYGLIQPGRYPVPASLFDVREKLADRVAEEADVSLDEVRAYYGKVAA